jgi:hypothetical protein
MYVYTFIDLFLISMTVFLIHSSEEEHEFTPVIQDVEIANVFWVNVLELMNPIRYRTLSWSIDEAIKPLRKYSWILWSLQKIGLGEMTFPCIYLPRPLPLLPQDKEEENKLFTRRDRYDFILWGLTLRMTSEIFQRGKIPIQINLTAPPVFPSANRLGQILLYIFYRLPKFSIHSNRPSSRL